MGFVSLLLGVTLCLQLASGAYTSAFGAEPDEASHYVTAVMIRDYIVQGLPGAPVSFAKNFYLHYPRVAFGLWPPLFHILSGLWMVVFGVSRSSVMFLLATFTVCWAWIFFRVSYSVIRFYGAAISALLLVLLPVTQFYTSSVMVDIPLALAMLLAMRAYARYLVSEKISDALLFGLFAALALLVKYNGFALVLLPPLCLVITGRYYLLRTKSFWLPALVVPLIAGPWYLAARRLVLYAAEPGAERVPLGLSSLVTSATGIILVAGPVIFGLALIGACLVSFRRLPRETNKGEARMLFSVSAAMVLAVFLFHVFYPLFEIRYSLPAAPALILLSWSTIDYVRLHAPKRRWLAASLLLLLAVQMVFIFQIPKKTGGAYVSTAQAVLDAGLPANGAVLVSADGLGEGMLTSEFVMKDRRPDHYVVRASKVLATQTLMGDSYQLIYQNPEALMTALDSIPVAIVVLQQCSTNLCGEHVKLLTQTVERYPDRFGLAKIIPSEGSFPILIYRINGNDGKPVKELHIDMAPTLGTMIEN
jgi:4-amino-4-deoxy-L-arabinose transferase-like glycosyltransferase